MAAGELPPVDERLPLEPLVVPVVEEIGQYGGTWQRADLELPANRLAWQHWTAEVDVSQAGYYEVWARAVDESGRSQPSVLPGWNPRGYLNNACHRIAVSIEA